MNDYETQLNEAEEKIIELEKFKNKSILETFQLSAHYLNVQKENERLRKELTITQNLYYQDSKNLREIIEAYRTPNYN